MAIIWPPNSHRRKYYVHHGTPGNFQYCRLSWGWKQTYFHYLQKLLSLPQMFTPAMGFYSQTCKRAKDLAFHSRPGTLEMNLFLYLFTFCSRKRALLCTNTSAWAFRNGLSLIFGESTGSMLFNSTIQSQIENIVRKNFWEKNSSCTLESTAILLLIKKTALWKHQLCSAETNLLEIDTCSFSKSKWQEAQGYLYVYLNGFSEPGLISMSI